MDKTLPIIVDTRPTILVAEDDPDQSDMLCEFLSAAGFHVETAFSGDVAFKKLVDHRYDLIIMDIRMPGMTGTLVLKALRQRITSVQLPVIVVTSFAADDDVERYLMLGANACVSKPYDMKELIALARDLTSQKRKIEVRAGSRQ